MGMTDKSLCDSCTNIGCEFQSGIVRTKCAFYIPSQLKPDNCGNYVIQESTTKNDIRDNRVKNELNRVKDEQEPTTKNDLGADREDAVERLNALKQFIGYDKDSEIVKATQKSLDMAIKALKHPEKNVRVMPSVTPQEPKTGHWENVPYEETLFCSECNLRLVDEQTYIPLHYCPNCGAKMED